jgi:hypothetical protein
MAAGYYVFGAFMAAVQCRIAAFFVTSGHNRMVNNHCGTTVWTVLRGRSSTKLCRRSGVVRTFASPSNASWKVAHLLNLQSALQQMPCRASSCSARCKGVIVGPSKAAEASLWC